MERINRQIFGYRRIKVSEEDVQKIVALFIRSHLQSEISPEGSIIISDADFVKADALLNGKFEYEISETCGIYGFFKRIKHKPCLFITSAIMVVFLSFISNLVWDIRISGNEIISDARIVSELRDNGLYVGKYWSNLDRAEIETKMLSSSEEIGWININRRGAVAYVEVVESSKKEDEKDASFLKYSNIVANVDCVIEDITVKRGVAVVKPGDVVKKGDLLISGVLTAEEGLCRAEGTVIGRMSDHVSVTTERKYVEKIETKDKLSSVSIKIFNFSSNILKKYGNLTNECDIIEDVKEYTLFGKCKLPFSLKREYYKDYSSVTKSYTDTEIVEVTSKRLEAITHSRLIGADLLRIRTYGEFIDVGYKMYSDIVFCAEVGEEIEFTVN